MSETWTFVCASADLLPLRQKLATARAARLEAEVKAWRQAESRLVEQDARRRADEARRAALGADPALQALANDNQALAEIAESLASDVRQEVTAQNAIKDILSDSRPLPVTIEKIVREVARTYGANPEDIRSKKRDAPISKMRQIAMYVVNEVTDMTQEAIGREFGGRHHTTVIYALREIKNEIDRDASLRATVNDIMKNVRENQS